MMLAGNARAQSGNWNVDASGPWSAPANWSPAAVPGTDGQPDAVVGLTRNITKARTVTNDCAVTLGTLNIGDSAGSSFTYTLISTVGGTLTFDVSSGNASIVKSISAQTDVIGHNITIADPLIVSNSASGALRFDNTITGTGDITLVTANGLIQMKGAIANTGNLTLKNETSTSDNIHLWTSPVNNNGCLTNSGSGSGRSKIDTTISNSVQSIVQNGRSGLYLTGNNNSYTGAVIIMKGQLQSANDTFYQSWGTGPVTLAGGSESNDTTLMISGGANNGTFESPIIVEANNPGRAAIITSVGNDARVFSGPITLNSHDLTITAYSTGARTFSGGVTGTGSLDLDVGSGGVLVGSVNPVGSITVRGTGGNTADLGTVGDNVTGITNNGPGSILRLDSPNTYSGPTVLNAGTNRVDASSIGTTASITSGPFGKGTLILNGGALATLNTTDRTFLNLVTINSNTVFGAAATYTGSLRFYNTVTLGSGTPTLTVNLPTSDSVRFDGAVQGSGGIVKDGPGYLIFAGTNTYSGSTTINAGRLSLKTTNSLPATTELYINAGGINELDFVGTNAVAGLWLGGVEQAKGLTYGGDGSGADIENATYFTASSGKLYVISPPSGTLILLR